MNRLRRLCIALAAVAFSSGYVLAKDGHPVKSLPAGKSTLQLDVRADGEPLPFSVYAYRPQGLGLDAKVLMVVHGSSRTAEKYRDGMIEPVTRHGYLLIVPHFTAERFPGFWRFAMGGLYSATGAPKPPEQSTFAVLERVFQILRRDYGLTAQTYDLFGHSAGGQFVHRMILFGQAKSARYVVAANSGTYTMPDETVPLPFGLSNAQLGPGHLKRVLTRPMMIMAGENDDDPFHRSLDRSREALAQGPHRLARATAFVERAKQAAAVLGVRSRWEFRSVPNTAHSGKRMGAAAVEYFAELAARN
jgi:poly(3-hydroxybutyrate) depolymerase